MSPVLNNDPFPLLSKDAHDLITKDIRPSTDKIYKCRFNKFRAYCADLDVDPFNCPTEVVTNFLTILRRVLGLKYQTICGYKFAISKYHSGILGRNLAHNPQLKRVTKACYNECPPLPRYAHIWEANTLLERLETMWPHNTLSLLELSQKTTSLIAILSLSRRSSLTILSPQFQVVDNTIRVPIMALEKNSRPNSMRECLSFPVGPRGTPLCLLTCLEDYMIR